MSGDNLSAKVPEDPLSHPGHTVVFWDGFDLPVAASFNPYFLVSNLAQALVTTKELVGFVRLFYFCEDNPVSDDMIEKYEKAEFFISTEYIGGNDPLCKSARANSMIGNILMCAVNLRTRPDDSRANIVIVSDSFSDEPELIRVLEDLKQLNFNILLVQSAEKEKLDNIPTESLDWLWTSILNGGINPQRDDTCGDDVPDDFCSSCKTRSSIVEEALDKDRAREEKRRARKEKRRGKQTVTSPCPEWYNSFSALGLLEQENEALEQDRAREEKRRARKEKRRGKQTATSPFPEWYDSASALGLFEQENEALEQENEALEQENEALAKKSLQLKERARAKKGRRKTRDTIASAEKKSFSIQSIPMLKLLQ